MSDAYIPKALRERISAQARYRCGYCLTPELIVGAPMELEHINPESLGGQTLEDNLWLACTLCNKHKGDRIIALDPVTRQMVRLFDPRHAVWREHFAWSPNGERIIGLTPTGRATMIALNLNRPSWVRSRRIWTSAGWWPPQD